MSLLISSQSLKQRLGMRFDRTQAEFTQTFWNYLDKRVSRNRIDEGRKQLSLNRKSLNKISKKYGVPAHVIVAFWGLESNYGSNTGSFRLADALSTLSSDQRRSEFFQGELLNFMRLVDKGYLNHDTKGSWAGAMGGVQFMPSNVLNYAVDSNGDGKIDLWNTQEDIFESAANFLKILGWKRGFKWGREVQLSSGFDFSITGLKTKKTLTEWSTLGVKSADGSALPQANITASVILPGGHRGPAFLIYDNFNVIMKWNRSILYAIAVGHLSDQFVGDKKLLTQKIIEKPLSKSDIMMIQSKLNKLGFDTGEPDGIAGPKTRSAARNYQIQNNLRADGYIGEELFNHLKDL
ncbi:MAG: lytic murein transglycosylase [Gammaproteobacteria bacterium]|nr:lytic murein transglycosylase [Gammaproteobacteria bacterium]